MSKRFGGYTTKTYNLPALTLIEKKDVDRAPNISKYLLETKFRLFEWPKKAFDCGQRGFNLLSIQQSEVPRYQKRVRNYATILEKDKLAIQLIIYLDTMDAIIETNKESYATMAVCSFILL
jgi:hypothetical protein